MEYQINSMFAEIRSQLEEDLTRMEQASQVEEETTDDLDSYFAHVAEHLVDSLSPNDALDFVFEQATAAIEDGLLPPIPAEDADEEEIEGWISAAEEAGLGESVLATFNESSRRSA